MSLTPAERFAAEHPLLAWMIRAVLYLPLKIYFFGRTWTLRLTHRCTVCAGKRHPRDGSLWENRWLCRSCLKMGLHATNYGMSPEEVVRQIDASR
jgi:hypothetical protein